MYGYGLLFRGIMLHFLLVVPFFSFMGAPISHAAPGDLDTTFDTDGVVTTNVGGMNVANGVAIQSDNKIVVAGHYNPGDFDLLVIRYLADGQLDTGFDGDGIALYDLTGSDDKFNDVAVQTDGKIVVVGTKAYGDSDFSIARLNANGSLDNTFDGDGYLTYDHAKFQGFNAVSLQADGKIVAVGEWLNSDGLGPHYIARFNADGSFDNTFDGDGIASAALSSTGIDRSMGVAIQTDGKIVVVGQSNEPGGNDFGLVRFNTNGSLDADFDGDSGTGNGTFETDFGGSDAALDVALQADGKIVVAGFSGLDIAVARYNTDGSLDTTFDGDSGSGNGKFTIDLGGGEIGRAVKVDSDGYIIIGGNTDVDGDNDNVIIRLNSSGEKDTTFGTNGVMKLDVSGTDDLLDIALQTVSGEKKIVAVGRSDGPVVTGMRYLNIVIAAGPTVPLYDGIGIVIFLSLIISWYAVQRKRVLNG